MRKISYLLSLLILTSCAGNIAEINPESSFDSLVNRFIIDSISNRFENPSSYKLIAVKTDTLTGDNGDKDAIKMYTESVAVLEKQKEEIKNDTLTDSASKVKSIDQINESIADSKNQLKILHSDPAKHDSILQINIVVKYQEVNKGVVNKNTIKLIYYPHERKFVEQMIGD